jgi:putative membrane protein
LPNKDFLAIFKELSTEPTIMLSFIIKWVLSAVAVLIAAYILPGVAVESFWAALLVAVILSLFNAVLRPILVILTIPVTVLTLGLFLLVINAVIVLLVDAMVGDFYVSGFWWALIFSLVISILGAIFDNIAESIG